MSIIRPTRFLSLALLGDALASGATGLLAFAGADLLAGPLGLPAHLLRIAGFALLPYAAFLALLGTRAAIPRGAAWAVVAVNVLWVVDSLVLLASDFVAPTALGAAFIAVQALAVAGFAAAQAYGLRSDAGERTAPASA